MAEVQLKSSKDSKDYKILHLLYRLVQFLLAFENAHAYLFQIAIKTML